MKGIIAATKLAFDAVLLLALPLLLTLHAFELEATYRAKPIP